MPRTKDDKKDAGSTNTAKTDPVIPSKPEEPESNILIKPTIGRVVLYNDGFSDQLCSAHIAYVHSDSMINIGYFNEIGMPQSKTFVTLRQDSGECLEGECSWMDYQIKNK